MSDRYTPEQMREHAVLLDVLDGDGEYKYEGRFVYNVASKAQLMLRQAAADAETLAAKNAEITRLTAHVTRYADLLDEANAAGDAEIARLTAERDAAEESARLMQDRLQRLIDSATAERAKVRELREWPRGHRTVRGSADYQQGIVDILELLESKLDALGLTGEEPR